MVGKHDGVGKKARENCAKAPQLTPLQVAFAAFVALFALHADETLVPVQVVILSGCFYVLRCSFVATKYALFSRAAMERIQSKKLDLVALMNGLVVFSWSRADRTLMLSELALAETRIGVDLSKLEMTAVRPEELAEGHDHPQLHMARMVNAALDDRRMPSFHVRRDAPSFQRAAHRLAVLAKSRVAAPDGVDEIEAQAIQLGIGQTAGGEEETREPMRVPARDVAVQLLLHPVWRASGGQTGEFALPDRTSFRLLQLPMPLIMMSLAMVRGLVFLALLSRSDGFSMIDLVLCLLHIMCTAEYVGINVSFILVAVADRRREFLLAKHLNELLTTGYRCVRDESLVIDGRVSENIEVWLQLRNVLGSVGANFKKRIDIFNNVFSIVIAVASVYLIVLAIMGQPVPIPFLGLFAFDLALFAVCNIAAIAIAVATARMREEQIQTMNVLALGAAHGFCDVASTAMVTKLETTARFLRNELLLRPVRILGVAVSSSTIASLASGVVGALVSAYRVYQLQL